MESGYNTEEIVMIVSISLSLESATAFILQFLRLRICRLNLHCDSYLIALI